MPSKEKVGLAQLRVGILAIVALTCLALLIFLLTGNTHWFTQETALHMYTSDAAGVAHGAPVRINGIEAGKVDRVGLSGETNPTRIIRIDFNIEGDMIKQIPADSIGSISSDNLLGSSKFLAINKGVSSELIHPDATLKSADTRQFDELVQKGYNVLDSLQVILSKAQDIVGQVEVGKGTLGKLLVDETLYNSLQTTVNQVQVLTTTLNSKNGFVGHLVNDEAFYNQIQGIVTKVDTLTTGLQNGEGTVGVLLKDPKLANQLNQTVGELNTMLKNLNSGKGTAGQLLADDKIARQLSQTLDKVNGTIDKVNAGQGTIGQLLVNPALYDSLDGTTRELHEFVKDFRANPKKFLRIQLHIF